jgi:hypothetical protein
MLLNFAVAWHCIMLCVPHSSTEVNHFCKETNRYYLTSVFITINQPYEPLIYTRGKSDISTGVEVQTKFK